MVDTLREGRHFDRMQLTEDHCASPGSSGDSCGCPATRCWVLPALLVLVLAGIVAVRAYRSAETQGQQAPDATRPPDATAVEQGVLSEPVEGEAARLSVDFANGARREFSELAWRDGMTVADLMVAAAQFRPGLEFSQSGEGEMAFLEAIEGISAEGQGGRNWIVYINGDRSQKGIGMQQVAPGDHILWKYEPYE